MVLLCTFDNDLDCLLFGHDNRFLWDKEAEKCTLMTVDIETDEINIEYAQEHTLNLKGRFVRRSR